VNKIKACSLKKNNPQMQDGGVGGSQDEDKYVSSLQTL